MKVLHTSDWHLGIEFYEQDRSSEFKQFLDWLINTIEQERIEVLLIAGDVFDTYHPSAEAMRLYYDFLANLHSRVKQCSVVIISGNHDSAASLNSAKNILERFRVHIVSGKPSNINDELVILKDEEGQPKLLVCAVPYLRRGDINFDSRNLSSAEESQEFLSAYAEHYKAVKKAAEKKLSEMAVDIPIIYMGHLFVLGCQLSDKERALPVGNLEAVHNLGIEDKADYIALGHLHISQKVGGLEKCCYSGSPLHFSKSEIDRPEAKNESISSSQSPKSVIKLEFTGKNLFVTEIKIPVFRDIVILHSSNKDNIMKLLNTELDEAIKKDAERWVLIDYSGPYETNSNLYDELKKKTVGSKVKILSFQDREFIKKLQESHTLRSNKNFEDIKPEEVFDCLISCKLDSSKQELKNWMKERCLELYYELEHEQK
ncbi:MAG: exonuclease subunit SbcD [Candidatus Bruticola sp.]